MAGVNITKERGRVTGVDLKVLTGNHVDMVKKLNAPQLINELFQNEVIDQDDIILINREHVKGRRQGVEQMLSIIHESGPKAFDGFVESLRMAGFTDMADRLHKEHRSMMLQQDETETPEPKTGNFKQLTEECERRDEEVRLEIRHLTETCQRLEEGDKNNEKEIREMKDNLINVLDKCQRLQERVEFLERRSNDVSDNYQKEGDINKNLEEDEKMKEKQIRELMERLCVLEGRSSDKFNFAKLPPFPRINTDGINTDGRKTLLDFIRRKKDLNTDGRKTVEDIVERWKDWERKIKVWLKNRKDCLYKLLKWWEGKQYKNVDVFKHDVKEWRDVVYKCLLSEVEMYDSFIEWIQFVCSLPDCLYDGLYVRLYVSLYDGLLWKSKDDLYRRIDVYKQEQDKLKVETERCINRLDQIISDEGKDNTGASSQDNTGASSKDNTGTSSKDNIGASIDNKFCIGFSGYYYTVDLTSAQTNFVRIYKHLKL